MTKAYFPQSEKLSSNGKQDFVRQSFMTSTKTGTCRAKVNADERWRITMGELLPLAASDRSSLLINVLALYLMRKRLQVKEMKGRKAFWVLCAENR